MEPFSERGGKPLRDIFEKAPEKTNGQILNRETCQMGSIIAINNLFGVACGKGSCGVFRIVYIKVKGAKMGGCFRICALRFTNSKQVFLE